MTEETTLTYGQRAVGIRFNHATGELHNEVDKAKQSYADIIDQMDAVRSDKEASPEKKRLASIAITEAQGAQMWAVKALTWND